MIRSKKINLKVKPLIEILGLDEVQRQLSQDYGLGEEEWVKLMLRTMTPAQRKAIKKRLLEEKEA